MPCWAMDRVPQGLRPPRVLKIWESGCVKMRVARVDVVKSTRSETINVFVKSMSFDNKNLIISCSLFLAYPLRIISYN